MSRDEFSILKLCIWEMNMNNPDVKGKYQLVVEVHNGGAVTFGSFYETKKEAQNALSKYRNSQPFSFDGGYAAAHLVINNMRRKV